MPLSAVMGTPCTRMCLISVTAGCGIGGSLLRLCGTLASTHAFKKPTVLSLSASFSDDLPKLGGR